MAGEIPAIFYGKVLLQHPNSTAFLLKLNNHFMAEINSNAGNNRQRGGVRRSKKLSTKVDLTPMVDLGFLLITFFIFTTAMSRPTAMKIYLPKEGGEMPTGQSTALTVIPIANNKIFYYHGGLADALKNNLSGITSFSVGNGIGEIIRQKEIALNHNPKHTAEDLMLIIKPSAEASYKNVVAALDEVLINRLKHYAFVDLDNAEKETLQKMGVK